jgi:hypothetical protein
MSRLDEKDNAERAKFAAQAPITSRDDSEQSATDYQVLYVLGFGIAGANLVNMTIFIYFVAAFTQG